MSRQIELLDKFYDNKATESEKRQLAGLLNDPDRWTDDFDKIWDHSFGHMPDSTDERIFKAITATANPAKINIRKFFMRMAPARQFSVPLPYRYSIGTKTAC